VSGDLSIVLQAAQLAALIVGFASVAVKLGRLIERVDGHENRITRIEDQ
jgi:hypothetical protein